MQKIMPAKNIFCVTNKSHYFNVLNQVKDLNREYDEDHILAEPASLNTAPAITFAIKYLIEMARIDLDEPIVFLPSDHYIADEKAFLDTLQTASEEVGGHIGTIGISPDSPKTAYGYIKKGGRNSTFYSVLEFKEKPDKTTAEDYLRTGQYVWNSGMYLFSARTFVNELRKHAPEIYQVCARPYQEFLESFIDLPKVSIDVAVSEKSDNVVVFEGNFGWNDIGSFDSLAEVESIKTNGCKHVGIDSKNIFVHSTKTRLVATVGIDDIGIIENHDSILIHRRGRSEDVKKLVDYLKLNNFKELNNNVVDYRPWGKYEILFDTPTYKVKKITVYPGKKLSLQSHHHRTEHWIVVRGIAKIVNADKVLHLRENESTFIPPMTTHRMENPGKINTDFIEVQTGNYLEEDDITRYEDSYNR